MFDPPTGKAAEVQPFVTHPANGKVRLMEFSRVDGTPARPEGEAATPPPSEAAPTPGIKVLTPDEMFKRAEAEGREQGMALVRGELIRLNEPLQQRYRDTIAALKTLDQDLIRQARDQAVELGLEIARRVVRRELQVNRDFVLEVVGQALRKLSQREQVTLRVNARDLAWMNAHKDDCAAMAEGVGRISVVEDSGVEQGGCVVEAGPEGVDATISSQLEILSAEVQKALKDETP